MTNEVLEALEDAYGTLAPEPDGSPGGPTATGRGLGTRSGREATAAPARFAKHGPSRRSVAHDPGFALETLVRTDWNLCRKPLALRVDRRTYDGAETRVDQGLATHDYEDARLPYITTGLSHPIELPALHELAGTGGLVICKEPGGLIVEHIIGLAVQPSGRCIEEATVASLLFIECATPKEVSEHALDERRARFRSGRSIHLSQEIVR